MIESAGDTHVKAQIISMVERYPSGGFDLPPLIPCGEIIEPDIPLEVAVTPGGPTCTELRTFRWEVPI